MISLQATSITCKPWSNYWTRLDPTSNIVGYESWDSGKTLSNIARQNKLAGAKFENMELRHGNQKRFYM